MFDTPEPDKWKWHVKAGILDVKQNCRTVIKLCYSRWVQYNCKSGNVIPCIGHFSQIKVSGEAFKSLVRVKQNAKPGHLSKYLEMKRVSLNCANNFGSSFNWNSLITSETCFLILNLEISP